MALFAPPNFYQSQNISAAATSNYFPQTFNNIIPSSPSNIAMKRRRENDESEPLPKRPHYEERIAHRFNSMDLSNENPVSPIDIMDDELEINEVDPEILDGDPQPFTDDFEEEPIIEEPEDEDRIVLSAELHRYMKNANEHNILSKFHKKPLGNELILWRPISNPLSSSASSMNDRITEINDDEVVDDGISDAIAEFPDESSSSARSSCSPPKIAENDPTAISSSSSSCCSSDGNRPSRMPPTNFSILQNQPDYEPMEMD
uniref:Uncharacterized protein n=1 Tax=Panagrolaimus sp. PS1159 TaxID=55785 RepID=A0AC35GN29_9BILA